MGKFKKTAPSQCGGEDMNYNVNIVIGFGGAIFWKKCTHRSHSKSDSKFGFQLVLLVVVISILIKSSTKQHLQNF